ncbi:hypothetical protein Ahy_A03g010516 [Arachis hypogaea]|uniref:NADH-quinone oxidoreductase subunit D domain-containing protein n=1 Tax=Arachis hypogaea TaxID=3818 RepID=A0A445DMR4_ARAHY|nr:hypothetical protein Ahy_A03g010516 [Arachis hypogaea]
MRMMHNFFRIGGVAGDLPHGWIDKCLGFCDYFLTGIVFLPFFGSLWLIFPLLKPNGLLCHYIFFLVSLISFLVLFFGLLLL